MWTDERVEMLRKLWSEGLSASQIAAHLGGVSRNAVIGKVHRLGLPGRKPKDATLARRGQRAPVDRVPKARRRSMFWQSLEGVAKLPLPLADVPIDPTKVKTLQDLEANDCRWPLGDPQAPTFGFCGCPKLPGLPYCEPHARRAYAPPAPGKQILPSEGDQFNRRGERVKQKERV